MGALLPAIEAVARILVEALARDGRVLAFGNGGSAADAQHLAAEFVGRMRRERGPLPALALTTDPSTLTALANDYGFPEVFARQIQAHARPGDVVVGITTSGASENVGRGLAAANARGTYGGHWNAHGTGRWWEFREPDARAVEAEMRAAAASGALVSVCHPKPFGPEWEYDASGYHAIEVWNGPWARLNSAALAFWEEHLRRGERIAGLGGSDAHRLRSPDPDPRHAAALGLPTTWVQAGHLPDASAIVAALREGRSFVSASPRGPQLYLEPHPARDGCVYVEVRDARGATLRLCSEADEIATAAIASDDWDGSFDLPAGAPYVRAEVVDGTGSMLALSNPIWADRL